jgi:hypothetical protein
MHPLPPVVSNNAMSYRSRLVRPVKLASKSARYLTLVTVLIAVSNRVAAQQTGYDKSSYPFTITRDILNFFYPEIFGKDRQVIFTAGQPVDSSPWGEFTHGFDFKITHYGSERSCIVPLHLSPGTVIPQPETITCLKGQIWIGPQGEIVRFWADGELAHSQQNEAIGRLVELHREWSDEQAGRALKEAGALYGPADKDEFVRSLHLPYLEKSLGLTILSDEDLKQVYDRAVPLIRFDGWSNPEHEGSFTGFDWVVLMKARLPDGSVGKYAFGFEPFEGKLTGINHLPEPPKMPRP